MGHVMIHNTRGKDDVERASLAFLVGNAAISAATGLWGSLALWTLWNGLLSYVLMGGLFAGEFMYRQLARRRGACATSGFPTC